MSIIQFPQPRTDIEILASIDKLLELLVGPAVMMRTHQAEVNGRAALKKAVPLLVQVSLAVKSDMPEAGGPGGSSAANERNLMDLTAVEVLADADDEFGTMARQILEVAAVSAERLADEFARIPRGALARVSYIGDMARRVEDAAGLLHIEKALERLAHRADAVLNPVRTTSVPGTCPACLQAEIPAPGGGTRTALVLEPENVVIACRSLECRRGEPLAAGPAAVRALLHELGREEGHTEALAA